jgi:hypothetical protein
MAQEVPNLFEGCSLLQKMSRAGMAQSMWSAATALDSRPLVPGTGHLPEAARRNGTKWRLQGHEEMTAGALRSGGREVFQNGVADGSIERIALLSVALRMIYDKGLCAPVDIAQ